MPASLNVDDLCKKYWSTLELCFPDGQPPVDTSKRQKSPQSFATNSSYICTSNWPPPFNWTESELYQEYVASLPRQVSQLEPQSLKATDDDLSTAFDHHSLITAQLPDSENDVVLTADEVIREIDLIMGHTEDSPTSPLYDGSFYGTMEYSQSELPEVSQFNEYDLNSLSLPQLSLLVEDLESCVQDSSAVLVQELAYREELDFEQEQKDVFIARLDELQRRLDKRRTRRLSSPDNSDFSSELGEGPDRESEEAAPSAAQPRSLALARLRKWAANAGGIRSRATSTFRALLRRANKTHDTSDDDADDRSVGSPPPAPVLAHSASGHLTGGAAGWELSSDDLEYKYLTTTIPYHHSANGAGPSVASLCLFNEMLQAILTSNPNLTPLLTDYILNVYAPADRQPSKLEL